MGKKPHMAGVGSVARAVTIQDVARRAGVSTATVSRALALPEQVSAKTREAVLEAIRETGYTPNAAARSLRARSTKMVLVLLPGIGNSFFTPVLTALEQAFSEGGYGVLIGYTRPAQGSETQYARVIRAGQVDGVLVVTGNRSRDEAFFAIQPTVPMSLMFSEHPGTAEFSVFDVANRSASAKIVRFMIEQGHRRVAYISGADGSAESNERGGGYEDALTEAGIGVDPDLIWRGASNFDFASGERAAARYFALKDKPTAVFAAADEIALGFMRALKNRGVNVPADVSVAGFDDTEYAVHYDPALTTMRQPLSEMGRLAATDMLRRMEAKGEPVATSFVRLPCELVIRESVRKLT